MITKLLSSKLLFFLLSTTLILGLNLIPLIMQYQHSPPGRSFTLIHNNTQDYYFYQALMHEGTNGAFLTSDPYTSEPHQPSIIFSYFLILGKLSKFFGLSYAVTYHLTRIIISFLFLLSIFYFLLSVHVSYPRLTYFFFLFAGPFMHTINDYGTMRSVPFMSWWNGIDPIRRAAFLPHHMLGGLLLVLSIILIFQYLKNPARHCLAKLILLSALTAYIHTPSLLILLIVLPPAVILQIASKHLGGGRMDSPEVEKSVIGLLIYWVIGLFFLFVMIIQTKNGFPWSQYIDWEKNLQFPLDRELIGALGILFPFSLIGIYSAVRSKKFEYIFTVCWLIVPFLFIPLAKILNLSNIRLIQGIPYLPLSILAILGIKKIIDFVISSKIRAVGLDFVAKLRKGKRELKRSGIPEGFPEQFSNTKSFQEPILRGIQNLILTIVILIFFVFTYPTLQWSLKDQIREYWPVYGNVYLDDRLFTAFKFINDNFPAKTITLSTFYAGNYLPAYTNTVSFIGHFGYTYNEKEKEEKTLSFFKGKMSASEAKSFLSSNKITLVFQGPEEKPLYKNYLYPTILKTVYDKEEATIYTMK